MALSTLPSELLLQIGQIVGQSVPTDIEHFGASSRRLRQALWPLIQEHRQCLRRYTTLQASNAAAAHVFFEVCQRPWVASYPRSLEISANKHMPTLEKPKTKRHIEIIDHFRVRRDSIKDDELTSVITGTDLVDASETQVWLDAVKRGHEDYLFALLVACLPNLERLIVCLDFEKLERVKDMVRKAKEGRPRRKSLANLKFVHVREREGARSCDLEMFPLLAAVPGVQKAYANNLMGMYRECYRDGWLSYAGASPSITHVRLESCGMSVEGLEVLLKSLKQLKEFHYVAHRAGWGLHTIGSMLKSAQGSLQVLVLSSGGGSPPYLGSLRSFTSLKHVTLDSDMLIKNRRLQRFVDLMPASLETCTIAGNNLTKPMEDKFLADLFRPSFSFPVLNKIYLEDSWGRRDIGQDRLKFQKEFHQQTTWMARYR